jgi:hypothetical protein
MKNNSLAMLATVSIVLGLASMIGYIDPAVCAGNQDQVFITCQQAADQHIAGFIGFTAFGLVTLIFGTIRSRIRSRTEK